MALVLHSSEVGAQQTSQQEQLESIREFVDSLTVELQKIEGAPSKALIREILAPSLRITVDLGEEEVKRDFLNALQSNIHKFALQEQQLLARFWSVRISSEYRNLASFVEAFPDSNGNSTAAGVSAPLENAPGHTVLDGLRKELKALPDASDSAGAELTTRILSRELHDMLEATEKRTKQAFLIDLRAHLYKFKDSVQKDILEKVPGLYAEVIRLIETMSQELSIWLDEERIVDREKISIGPLMEKGRALFEAILRPAFRALFGLLGNADRKGKETFLLKLGLVLSTCPGVAKQAGLDDIVKQCESLRYQYFFMKELGDLMDDWVQRRISDLNDEFKQRAGEVLEANPHPILLKLRRLFRPGKIVCHGDPNLEDEIFSLFLDSDFPRHVLLPESIVEVLEKAATHGGPNCNFKVHDKSAVPDLPTDAPPSPPPISSSPLEFGSPMDPWGVGPGLGTPDGLGPGLSSSSSSTMPLPAPLPFPTAMSQPAPIPDALALATPKSLPVPISRPSGPDPLSMPTPMFQSAPPAPGQTLPMQQPPPLFQPPPLPMSQPGPGTMFTSLPPMSQPGPMFHPAGPVSQPAPTVGLFPGMPPQQLLPPTSQGPAATGQKFGLDDDEI